MCILLYGAVVAPTLSTWTNAALASEFELPFSDRTPTEREYVCGGHCHHPTETAQSATSGPHAEGRTRGRCRRESGSDPAVPGSGSSADVLFSSSTNTNSYPHVKTSVARTYTGLQSTARTAIYSYHFAKSFEYRVRGVQLPIPPMERKLENPGRPQRHLNPLVSGGCTKINMAAQRNQNRNCTAAPLCLDGWAVACAT